MHRINWAAAGTAAVVAVVVGIGGVAVAASANAATEPPQTSQEPPTVVTPAGPAPLDLSTIVPSVPVEIGPVPGGVVIEGPGATTTASGQ
ncbi:hypothetical protein GCM10027413_24870 [Conyzicola nivalis]|uniref:Uncharacterized protein n=1 Tax=Conyzicola nivalis TaxID=1477021 RepID=A0A916WDY2_9MICO|nr:hypothetical protein [Conyzicola nivalis]GGA90698.1 hypothetical protein GCM10010979_01750 [Conyzicola nivalis]